MAKWTCPECSMRSRNAVQFEAHRAIHSQIPTLNADEPAGLPEGVEAVLEGAGVPSPSAVASPPSSAPSSESDSIDPFDIPAMPEFPTQAAPTPDPFVTPDVITAAFSERDIAAMLKAIFSMTAEMAGTGPAGQLSDAEAGLIANLMRDYLNRQIAANFGNDPGQAKMIAALALIALSKARVYLGAIKRKKSPAIAVPASEEPTALFAANNPDATQEVPTEIRFEDDGALAAVSA